MLYHKTNLHSGTQIKWTLKGTRDKVYRYTKTLYTGTGSVEFGVPDKEDLAEINPLKTHNIILYF